MSFSTVLLGKPSFKRCANSSCKFLTTSDGVPGMGVSTAEFWDDAIEEATPEDVDTGSRFEEQDGTAFEVVD